jgi:hypothetical protein
MNACQLSKPQRRLLRGLLRWGELSPDAESEVGCTGAAFEAVIAAVQRRGLAEIRTEGGCTFLAVTDCGRAALSQKG